MSSEKEIITHSAFCGICFIRFPLNFFLCFKAIIQILWLNEGDGCKGGNYTCGNEKGGNNYVKEKLGWIEEAMAYKKTRYRWELHALPTLTHSYVTHTHLCSRTYGRMGPERVILLMEFLVVVALLLLSYSIEAVVWEYIITRSCINSCILLSYCFHVVWAASRLPGESDMFGEVMILKRLQLQWISKHYHCNLRDPLNEGGSGWNIKQTVWVLLLHTQSHRDKRMFHMIFCRMHMHHTTTGHVPYTLLMIDLPTAPH